MRNWLLGGLSALMLMGATGAAAAQETDPVEGPATLDGRISDDRALIDDLARQLDESLRPSQSSSASRVFRFDP